MVVSKLEIASRYDCAPNYKPYFKLKTMDIQLLKNMIENATRQAFDGVRLRHPDQTFCGYALYSDLDAVTVCPAVNSLQNLEKRIASDPADAAFYKWNPGEWDHDFEGAEHFQHICRILQEEVHATQSTEAHEELKDKVYETCVLALNNLKHSGYFHSNNDTVILVFTVTNGEAQRETRWVSQLNSDEVSDEFIRWIAPVAR